VRKLILSLATAALCLGLGACSDDDPVKPQEFTVTIQVTDPAGNPVEGLRVGLLNDNPYMQDGIAVAKASAAIRFQIPVPCRVQCAIQDIEGQAIREMVDADLPAGVHQIVWNGRDNADVHQPSGRYTFHMVALQLGTGQQLFEDRTDMLLAMLDTSRVPAGYTDARGRLVLKDRKLFPHLYNRPDMTATDETGEAMGKLTLTPSMRISLVDESGGGAMRFLKEVSGSGTLELTWDPVKGAGPKGSEPATPWFPGVAKTDTTNPIPFELGPVYPNPFN